jgi:Family of unknown function (DUF6807)
MELSTFLTLFSVIVAWSAACCPAGEINIDRQEDWLTIRDDGNAVATYVFRDADISRPYFCNVSSPGGVQVTRHHPPHADDLQDHATFHPGIWLAFGDISGNDDWRLKARVEHAGFREEPRVEHGTGTFTVLNRYLAERGNDVVCQEVCRHEFRVVDGAYVLTYDCTFTGEREFVFGDQEEMGLGVRLATSIAESQGQGGLLTDSEGRTTARNIWGRQADWCDYSGGVDGRDVGVTILAHPDNFRPSWWHARDYGFVAANPFGRKAFTRGEPSRVVVAPGEELRLRFAVVIHDGRPGDGFEPDLIYGRYVSGKW